LYQHGRINHLHEGVIGVFDMLYYRQNGAGASGITVNDETHGQY